MTTEIVRLLAQLLNLLLTLLILVFRFEPVWPKANHEHSSFVTRSPRSIGQELVLIADGDEHNEQDDRRKNKLFRRHRSFYRRIFIDAARNNHTQQSHATMEN